jgi:hypothetical protein
MSIKSRMRDINALAGQPIRQVSKFQSKSRKMFFRTFHVDSVHHDDKSYQVQLGWGKKNGQKFITGKLIGYDWLQDQHPANKSQSICYQVLALVKALAAKKGYQVSFSENEAHARKLLNFGGELIKISNPAGAMVWAVYRPVGILVELPLIKMEMLK